MWQALRTTVENSIRTHGQHVVGVVRSAGDASDFVPFLYTVNHGRGLPELLLMGDSGTPCASLLNALGSIQRERGVAFRHGEPVGLGGLFPMRMLDTGREGHEYATVADAFYRTGDVAILQVLLPDKEGRYPGDPDCQTALPRPEGADGVPLTKRTAGDRPREPRPRRRADATASTGERSR